MSEPLQSPVTKIRFEGSVAVALIATLSLLAAKNWPNILVPTEAAQAYTQPKLVAVSSVAVVGSRTLEFNDVIVTTLQYFSSNGSTTRFEALWNFLPELCCENPELRLRL